MRRRTRCSSCTRAMHAHRQQPADSRQRALPSATAVSPTRGRSPAIAHASMFCRPTPVTRAITNLRQAPPVARPGFFLCQTSTHNRCRYLRIGCTQFLDGSLHRNSTRVSTHSVTQKGAAHTRKSTNAAGWAALCIALTESYSSASLNLYSLICRHARCTSRALKQPARAFSIVTRSRTIRVLTRCSATETSRIHGCTYITLSSLPPPRCTHVPADPPGQTYEWLAADIRVAPTPQASQPRY